MTNKDRHHTLTYHHMRKLFIGLWLLGATVCQAQNLTLNDLDYFECQGVNVLVFSNPFNGGFNDEKNSGIEIIHHGVRTIQGGFDKYIKDIDKQNPYGVPIGLGNWASVNMVLIFGIAVNYAHLYYPDIISKDEIYRVANWLYG